VVVLGGLFDAHAFNIIKMKILMTTLYI
jgi:hypothetical protein